MEPDAGTGPRSITIQPSLDQNALDSLQFNEEIQHLMTVPPENANSFTALLELPAPQAMELLHHSPESNASAAPPFQFSGGANLTFPSNTALIERAARFSVFAAAADNNNNNSPETTGSVPSNSSGNLGKVKSEPAESDSNQDNPNSSQPNQNQKSMKRKEREKKAKAATKKSKSSAIDSNEDAEKLPYVHISGTALVLDEIINHVQSLQRQVEFLSMRLAAVNPRIDVNLDSILAAESGSLMDSNYSSMVMPLMWPELQISGNRQQYEQQWHLDAHHQPAWGREENQNFVTPENSLLSYDSSANSASLHSNHLKMEL
ncbi:hypothetical protein EZV62_005434 [Acer yangbiense]|uniref:BHLH domain-containing protein n=1 Tax=Acer yangbiense TaxID=1000413 RepID=A0A5C7IN54_9ROSI|nr:hypothetical protein EZV62_005434 [Acer yangbiense]